LRDRHAAEIMLAEVCFQRRWRHGAVISVKLKGSAEYAPMDLLAEILGLKDLRNRADHFRMHEHCAKDRLLTLDADGQGRLI
jgi:hypothetical protein